LSSDSQISGLYRLTVTERIEELRRCGWLSVENAKSLEQGRHVISVAGADKIIENVVGVFGLPLAIAPNFLVNGRDHMVPMVVEEPSIVAGASNIAKLARACGGFTAEYPESLLAGQVYIAGIDDPDSAVAVLEGSKAELLELANAVLPRLKQRGGGVREIQIRRTRLDASATVIAMHVFVDTCDAMGANMVNQICEAIAPRISSLCGGDVALRILSNLADRSMVKVRASFRLEDLATEQMDAVTVRDGVILASDIAAADPYRAATHNKGIMNGIDALAIATGNDWRAIEAGAHAYAAVTGRYAALSTWSSDDEGNLVGEMRIPLKVGIVGGTVAANPAAAAGIEIAGLASARELAELMAAVGLAQNLAALKALVSSGIQHGHMRLHARSVVAAADVPNDLFDAVVQELITDGDISISRARELLAGKQKQAPQPVDLNGHAAGKVILLGEHAAVYGKFAVAVPIAAAVRAGIERTRSGTTISIPDWGVLQDVNVQPDATGLSAIIAQILKHLSIDDSGYAIHVQSRIPPAMGLGASASIAVAIIRAFSVALRLGLGDDDVNSIAFECEKLAHGTPSGVDNTVATLGKPILFRNADSLQVQVLELHNPLPLVIAHSHESGATREQVAGVRARYDRNPARYGELFAQIDAISQEGARALEANDDAALGLLMNVCHGLLNAIGVSTPELESMVSVARDAGAVGAKLTGSGGGGSIVALCPGSVEVVTSALHAAGYRTLSFEEKKET
jgi:hydroxymethylglutaryl-CoA reductase